MAQSVQPQAYCLWLLYFKGELINMFEITKELQELKDIIDGSISPVEVYDNAIFGPNYQYTIPLFCAENGYKCLYQPSRILYVIYRISGENHWEEI